jgi:hypothetical protein
MDTMAKITFIDNCKVDNKYTELLSVLEKHVWNWDTQKENFMRSISGPVKRLETFEEGFADWNLEDTPENRQRLLDYWRTDYIEWFEVEADNTLTFGQGDYNIVTSLDAIALEENLILGYDEVCTHRLKIVGEFKWEY